MKIKFYALIMFAALVTSSVSGCGNSTENASQSEEHHHTGYVPWGIDEFELFSLTRDELQQKFKDELRFKNDYAEAVMAGGDGPGFGQPHFQLSFDKDKTAKVTAVQRVFVDGAGCDIKGPLLTSKVEALKFSIDGLSKCTNLNEKEAEKLATAKELLANISK
jgi:hypothetical protein